MQLPLKKHVYLENLERNVFSRQLFHCLHSEKPFTASFKCLGLNMRAITPWRLLPKPLSTDEAWHIFFFLSQILSSVFRVSRPRVTLVQRQRTRGVPENQILHFYSVTHKTASQAFLLWKDFLKALEGKKRGHRTRSVNTSPLSQGGLLQRSQCPFTHQFTLSSTLHSSSAPGVLPRKPVINQSWTESSMK